jgi:transcription initiation factor IIF auxiliary subunit
MEIVNKRVFVRESLFNPASNDRKIYFVKGDEKEKLYKVWIYLEGEGLSFVESVVYKLHPTFPNPERKVARSLGNPNCSLMIWTWGLFTIEVTINFVTGETLKTKHYTTYDKDLGNDTSMYSEQKSFV